MFAGCVSAARPVDLKNQGAAAAAAAAAAGANSLPAVLLVCPNPVDDEVWSEVGRGNLQQRAVVERVGFITHPKIRSRAFRSQQSCAGWREGRLRKRKQHCIKHEAD